MELVECPIPQTPEILIKVFGKKKLDDFLSDLFESVYQEVHRRILAQAPCKYFSQEKLESYLIRKNISNCLTSYYTLESQRLENLIQKVNIPPEELGKRTKMAGVRIV